MSGEVTKAHDQKLTLHLITHVPEHEPRQDDPHYHLFEQCKARMKRLGLWRCVIDDEYCGGNIELHHSHIEYSQVGSADLQKVNQALGLHLISDQDFQSWIESPGNLEPLCAVHHRTHFGVHVIPGPLWEPLRYRKAGVSPAAEFVAGDQPDVGDVTEVPAEPKVPAERKVSADAKVSAEAVEAATPGRLARRAVPSADSASADGVVSSAAVPAPDRTVARDGPPEPDRATTSDGLRRAERTAARSTASADAAMRAADAIANAAAKQAKRPGRKAEKAAIGAPDAEADAVTAARAMPAPGDGAAAREAAGGLNRTAGSTNGHPATNGNQPTAHHHDAGAHQAGTNGAAAHSERHGDPHEDTSPELKKAKKGLLTRMFSHN